MPIYRIHRLRDSLRAPFRAAAHLSGTTVAKPKDYLPGESCEAATPYAAWALWRDTAEALQVGDILESETGTLVIYKFIGFEEACWWVPVPRPMASQAEPSLGEASARGTQDTQ